MMINRAFAALNQGNLKTLNELFDPDGPWDLPNGKTIPQCGPNYRVGQVLPNVRRA
jgi:hypothetical protein